MLKETYCTNCKLSVKLNDIKYLRLTNNRLAIEGCCAICKTKLLKLSVMPRSGKKPIKRYRKWHGVYKK